MGDRERACHHRRAELRLAYRLEERLVPPHDDVRGCCCTCSRCSRSSGACDAWDEQRHATRACRSEKPAPRESRPSRRLVDDACSLAHGDTDTGSGRTTTVSVTATISSTGKVAA
jgi:hypothetical protein